MFYCVVFRLVFCFVFFFFFFFCMSLFLFYFILFYFLFGLFCFVFCLALILFCFNKNCSVQCTSWQKYVCLLSFVLNYIFIYHFTGLRRGVCKPDSCKNGGTCRTSMFGFNCHCPAGFTGMYCGIPVKGKEWEP